MVDNRISSVPVSYFKAGDASGMANKMSEEKYGQGAEYFKQDTEEQDENQNNKQEFQDRSAILRASLNVLAAANVGSIRFMKMVKDKEKENKNKREKNKKREKDETFE